MRRAVLALLLLLGLPSAHAGDLPASPARPVKKATLDDEATLALASAAIPSVKEEWRRDVATRAKVIRSLFSDDFSDLQFLKPLLKDARVVQLGESAHGVAEFSWMKVRLIKFLHQQMGFDVVAFESSMSECEVADERIANVPPLEVMKDCTFAVWHSSETLDLFEYFDSARRTGRRLTLAGFDTQSSGAARPEVSARLEAMVAVADPAMGARLAEDEKRLGKLAVKPGNKEALELVPRYEEAADLLARNRTRLREHFSERPILVDLAIEELRSRARFARQIGAEGREAFNVRDEGMASNLDFLLDTMYTGRKMIVWAHNVHIARQPESGNEQKPMGSWLAKRRKPGEVYSVGIYMGRGVGAMNDRKRYEINVPLADSLEAVLANAGRRMSFVDFSHASPSPATSWMFQPIDSRDWGLYGRRFSPASLYDAVVYIDTVTPPDYL
jgi:erythromycin esterase